MKVPSVENPGYRGYTRLLRTRDTAWGRNEGREVSGTLTKKLDAFAGPGEIKRREVVLDPQVSPEEIKSREVELGYRQRVGLLLPQLFPKRRSYGHCLCDSVLHSSWDSNCVVRWSLRNAGRTLP